MEQIGTVTSLCPECLKRIEGVKFVEEGKVYIKKECPEHGSFTALISSDIEHYNLMDKCFEVDRAKVKAPLTKVEKGCPFDCGICPEHTQDTCLAVVEVTDRCNMGCTYCFANSSMDESLDPDMDTIRGMFETVLKCQNEPTCIQISGGEPTLRNDLPEIIKMAKDMGINHVELNTNGNRIARDQEYFDKIAAAGVDSLYLGFDGVSDDIYIQRTGKKQLDLKSEAINKCEKAGIGVVLVPLVAKNYNLHEVGKIIDFASKHLPTIRGVHYQPVFFSGRSADEIEAKVTTPELLKAIEEQTNGQIKMDNFTPALMPTAHCGATCLTLVNANGGYMPLTDVSMGAMKSEKDVASKTKGSIMGRWKGSDDQKNDSSGDLMIKGSCCDKPLSDLTIKSSCCETPISDLSTSSINTDAAGEWGDFVNMSTNSYLTISMMAFQDVWTYEKERVENCCIHVVTRDGKFIPFCNYNMTDCKGNHLYR